MKKLKHRVQVNVAGSDGDKEQIMISESRRIPHRILRMLFGELTEVMLITPGKSVEGIEIKEVSGEE